MASRWVTGAQLAGLIAMSLLTLACAAMLIALLATPLAIGVDELRTNPKLGHRVEISCDRLAEASARPPVLPTGHVTKVVFCELGSAELAVELDESSDISTMHVVTGTLTHLNRNLRWARTEATTDRERYARTLDVKLDADELHRWKMIAFAIAIPILTAVLWVVWSLARRRRRLAGTL
jgi:hypothetical protein